MPSIGYKGSQFWQTTKHSQTYLALRLKAFTALDLLPVHIRSGYAADHLG